MGLVPRGIRVEGFWGRGSFLKRERMKEHRDSLVYRIFEDRAPCEGGHECYKKCRASRVVCSTLSRRLMVDLDPKEPALSHAFVCSTYQYCCFEIQIGRTYTQIRLPFPKKPTRAEGPTRILTVLLKKAHPRINLFALGLLSLQMVSQDSPSL